MGCLSLLLPYTIYWSYFAFFFCWCGSQQTDENILLGNIVRYYYIGNIQPLTIVNIFKFYLFRKIRTLKVARLAIYMKSGDPWKSFRWNIIDDYIFSPVQVTEEEQWNHYNEFVFLRKSDYPCNFRPVAASSQLEYF